MAKSDTNLRDYFLGVMEANTAIAEIYMNSVLLLSKVLEAENPKYVGLGDSLLSEMESTSSKIREEKNKIENSDYFLDGFNRTIDDFLRVVSSKQ